MFKSLFRRESPPPRLHSGMPAEVLNAQGTRIFSGRLRILEDGVLEVRAPENTMPAAPPVYHQEVRVRGFSQDGKSIAVDGIFLAGGLWVWRIGRQRPASSTASSSDFRSTFRQHAGIEGRLHTPSDQVISCKVQNISAGGVQITAPRLFQLKSSLHLEVVLLAGEPPFSLDCQVKWIHVQSRLGSFTKRYTYGCQFLDVPPREQERLLRALFTLERNTYRRTEE